MSISCVKCDELPDEDLGTCTSDLGGSDQILLVECGVPVITDPSDEVAIALLIADEDAKIYHNLKVGVDAASPIEVDSPVACQTPSVINYDRTATLISGNMIPANIVALNTLNNSSGNSWGQMLIYECENNKVQHIVNTVKIKGSIIFPPENNELKRFEGTMSWRAKGDPLVSDAPAGIFS